MKRYIITEEELEDIQHCCIQDGNQKELRAITAREVPEWATHFTNRYAEPLSEEIPE